MVGKTVGACTSMNLDIGLVNEPLSASPLA
jgi:hypothetical protein